MSSIARDDVVSVKPPISSEGILVFRRKLRVSSCTQVGYA